MTKKILFLMLLLGAFLTGCNTATTSTDDENIITVTTTIFPLEDFTKKIGGEFVNVSSVYPAGVDAHTYEPSTKTMIQIAESDLFIHTGTGLEAFAEKAADSLASEDVKIVEASAGISLLSSGEHKNEEHDEHTHEEDGHEDESHDTEHSHDEEEHEHEHESDSNHEEGHEEEHNHGDLDPHVWIDPILAIQMAENIKNELMAIMPEQKDYFQENFDQLTADLKALDAEFQAVVKEANHRKILVSHGAYGYWEQRYGIEQLSVTGISPTQEPSQKQLENLIDTVQSEDIHFIIFEQNISTKISDIIKNELYLEVLYLHNVSVLTDADIENNEDYFTLMRKNLEVLTQALQ
ncbi:metal ABC transporter substrate-binding protein [Bacillus carboniphilus]|uniref:Metal ABC transporter substrate-binding protein n=1 Tax=Bacillus carboniphilus TaxID=86663 RepID=A0ABP3FHD5_9BACI